MDKPDRVELWKVAERQTGVYWVERPRDDKVGQIVERIEREAVEAAYWRMVRPEGRRSPAMSLEQFGDALGMDWRVFKNRAEAEWGLRQQGRKSTVDLSRMSAAEAERVERHFALLVERRANKRLVRRSRQTSDARTFARS